MNKLYINIVIRYVDIIILYLACQVLVLARIFTHIKHWKFAIIGNMYVNIIL